jgi:hypothetical protein
VKYISTTGHCGGLPVLSNLARYKRQAQELEKGKEIGVNILVYLGVGFQVEET